MFAHRRSVTAVGTSEATVTDRLRVRKNINFLLGMQFDLLGKSCIPLAVQLLANKNTGSY